MLTAKGLLFEIEWSKLKTDYGTTEASILGEDDDSEEDVDFEKTISEEVMKGSLEKKRAFMVKFLNRKNYELGNRKISQRTLKIDSQVAGKSTTTFKLKKGEKIFHIKDSDVDDGDTEVIAEELEKSFLGQVTSKPAPGAEGKKPKKYPPKGLPSQVWT